MQLLLPMEAVAIDAVVFRDAANGAAAPGERPHGPTRLQAPPPQSQGPVPDDQGAPC
jgi:hypothetical protein